MSSKREKRLTKLTLIAKAIERNTATANGHLKLYYLLASGFQSLSGGSENDDQTPEERAQQNSLDFQIDFLQALIAQQQAQLAAAQQGGSHAGGQASNPPNPEEPCSALLDEFQAALKVGDQALINQYLTEYETCMGMSHTVNKPRPLIP